MKLHFQGCLFSFNPILVFKVVSLRTIDNLIIKSRREAHLSHVIDPPQSAHISLFRTQVDKKIRVEVCFSYFPLLD